MRKRRGSGRSLSPFSGSLEGLNLSVHRIALSIGSFRASRGCRRHTRNDAAPLAWATSASKCNENTTSDSSKQAGWSEPDCQIRHYIHSVAGALWSSGADMCRIDSGTRRVIPDGASSCPKGTGVADHESRTMGHQVRTASSSVGAPRPAHLRLGADQPMQSRVSPMPDSHSWPSAILNALKYF